MLKKKKDNSGTWALFTHLTVGRFPFFLLGETITMCTMCAYAHMEQPRTLRGHSDQWGALPLVAGGTRHGGCVVSWFCISKESSPGVTISRGCHHATRHGFFQPSPPLPAAPSDASPQPSSSPVPPTRAAKLPSAAVRAPFHGSPACSTLSRSAARSDSSCSLALRRA